MFSKFEANLFISFKDMLFWIFMLKNVQIQFSAGMYSIIFSVYQHTSKFNSAAKELRPNQNTETIYFSLKKPTLKTGPLWMIHTWYIWSAITWKHIPRFFKCKLDCRKWARSVSQSVLILLLDNSLTPNTTYLKLCYTIYVPTVKCIYCGKIFIWVE